MPLPLRKFQVRQVSWQSCVVVGTWYTSNKTARRNCNSLGANWLRTCLHRSQLAFSLHSTCILVVPVGSLPPSLSLVIRARLTREHTDTCTLTHAAAAEQW